MNVTKLEQATSFGSNEVPTAFGMFTYALKGLWEGWLSPVVPTAPMELPLVYMIQLSSKTRVPHWAVYPRPCLSEQFPVPPAKEWEMSPFKLAFCFHVSHIPQIIITTQHTGKGAKPQFQ